MPADPTGRSDTRLLPLRPGETPLAVLSVLMLITATIVALATGGNEFLFYIAVVAALMILVTAIHRRFNLTIPALWALLAWATLHMAGGMVPLPDPTGVLYNFWILPGILKYDQFVHAYGFGVTAWVCWLVLRSICRVSPTGVVPLAASALCSMGLGALNEEIEFAATKLVDRTNVGGYENNAWDLVFNMIGALTAVLLIRATHGPRPRPKAT